MAACSSACWEPLPVQRAVDLQSPGKFLPVADEIESNWINKVLNVDDSVAELRLLLLRPLLASSRGLWSPSLLNLDGG